MLLLELGVQRGERGVLGLEALRGLLHFDRQPPRVLVRRLALARDRQVGGGVLEHRARVRRQVAREQHHQQPHQAVAGAQRHQGDGASVVRGVPGRQAQLRAHRLRGRTGIVNHRCGFAHQLPHHVARQRMGRGAPHRGRRPLIGIVVRLVQGEPWRTGGRREHLQRRTEARHGGAPTRSAAGRRIERGAQSRNVLLHPLAPGQRRRHLIHAARDHPELFGLALVQPLGVAARRDALERQHDAPERPRQPAPVVPQADGERDEHDRQDDRRLDRGLDGVVAHVGGELAELLELRLEAGRRVQPLELFEAMGQVDHVGLGAAGALPRDVPVREHGDGDREKHHRPVAIKVLHPELSAALGGGRFLREIEIAARLQHPHILPLYDSGQADGLLFYVMPYVEGESLRDRLLREKQLSLEETLRITFEVAGALAYAHSHGVVHRDIKPENIMLSGGSAVVADFGIARALSAAGEGRPLTQTGTVIGTPAYMSPEQATGNAEIDGRSDQYSLACVTYEMLVGEPPFTGPTAQAIMARHSLDHVSPPSIVRATIPETVEGAILRALAKVPADRYLTTALFAEALAAPGAPAGGRRTSRATAAPRWTRVSQAGAVAGAILVLAVGTWLAVGRRHSGAAAPATTGLDPRHIAVLYFEDLTPKRDLAYLADGLTEALIADLTRVSGLAVISRNGVTPYRAPEIPPDSVARALGVGTLVRGSVVDAW